MAKIGLVQNGLKKANGTKRKSNPLGLARVKGFAKKNGLKLVPKGASVTAKAVANGTKKRKGKKRRNGTTATKRFTLSRNGLLGNTKSDVKNVGAILGGLLGGKAVGRVVNSFAAPYLNQVGLGGYSEIISDSVVALVAVPFVASKFGGGNTASMARLGAMANVVVDVIEMVAPNTLSLFGANPVVSNGSQVGLTPQAVAQLVNSTNASQADKAKIAGAMQALAAGAPVIESMPSPMSVMPLYE